MPEELNRNKIGIPVKELNKNKIGIPVKATRMRQTCLDSEYLGMLQAPGVGSFSHSFLWLDVLDI